MSTKAQAAKDKGNTAFKNGDFPSAIGHYSQAILEDPKNWTFPLNRAAAYLKLGKNEDAEKDCTVVLALNASNVKALFRRAQAKKELGKLVEAQKDLEQATSLDPSNESVKTEMIAVKDLLWKKSTSDVVHPLRRRVPIKIIEPSDSSSDVAVAAKTSSASASSESSSAANTTAIAKDVGQTSKPTEDGVAPTLTSTNSGSPSTSISLPHTPLSSTTSPPKNVTESPSLSSPTTKPSSSAPEIPSTSSDIPSASNPPSQESSSSSSFQEAKRAREERNTKITRVGGGIFRASGKNTIFNVRESGSGSDGAQGVSSDSTRSEEAEAAPPKDPSTTWGASVTIGTETTTLFEFTKGWIRLDGSEKASAEERVRYIMTIAPSSYPNMFQNSLEPPLLVGMFRTFREALDQNSNSNKSNSALPLPLRKAIASVLHALLKVRRIRTVVMFLKSAERDMMRRVVDEVLSDGGDGEEGREARDSWRSMLK